MNPRKSLKETRQELAWDVVEKIQLSDGSLNFNLKDLFQLWNLKILWGLQIDEELEENTTDVSIRDI